MDSKRLSEINKIVSEGILFAKMSGKEPDLEEICKSFSSDLSARFPNGRWVTMNGSKVFINNGKAIFGAPELIKLVNEDGNEGQKESSESYSKRWKSLYSLGFDEYIEKVRDNDRVKGEMSKYGINEIEAVTLMAYTDALYSYININILNGYDNQTANEVSEVIESALSKLPDYKGVVYRGMHIQKDEPFYDSILSLSEGDEVQFPNFSSSSTNERRGRYFSRGVGRSVFLEIESKSGKFIDNLSYFGNENEVLFKRNSKFKVIESHDMGDSTKKLKLKEI